MIRKARIKITAMILLCCMPFLTACSKAMPGKVVLTTGFSANEVFWIEDSSCTLTEALVYLVNTQNAYASRFGSGIYAAAADPALLDEQMKDSCLARISKVKAMNLLAKEKGISLTAEEEQMAADAASSYAKSLTREDLTAMDGVSTETLTNMYREYALADKLYRCIVKNINPEVSDDEARTITVQQILFRTSRTGDDGSTESFSESEKAAVRQKANAVLARAREGAEFTSLMDAYNEADESTVSFGKGEKEASYEEAAFNLETDGISGLIETSEGYYIIKCLTTFNREETEANKVKIVEERRRQVFGEEYDAFARSLTRELNSSLWEKVSLPHDAGSKTNSFFSTYESVFTDYFTDLFETEY